jgi:hypothetical protein
VHALERDFLTTGCLEQVTHQVLGSVRSLARDAETRATAFHRHAHSVLDQAQVLVERTAQVREPGIVGRHEIEFAGGLDWGW